MVLKDLITDLKGVTLTSKKNVNINSLKINSKDCVDGSLFFCLEGENFDGHMYAVDAIKNGAVAIVVNRQLPLDIPQIVVNSPRSAMPLMASNFYGRPSEKLKLIAISGTNGKTTTTYIIKKILEKAGNKVGLVGTSANYIGNIMLPPKLTTPDPIDLHALFAQMVSAGCTYAVMEASAHAIYHKKLEGIVFDTAVLTNITQDHLDFFKTFENYKNTKLSFFNSTHTKSCVFNMDDPAFFEAVSKCDVPYFSFSSKQPADISAQDCVSSIRGNNFTINMIGEKYDVELPLLGKFNISNALQAASACLHLNVPKYAIVAGLNNIEQVKGRFNIIDTGLQFETIVDYAHTPDGVDSILSAVNAITHNKVICVFGCGGNRDTTKRPIMGEIATNLASYVVITSDNPRFENPVSIINQIEKGIKKENYEIEPDRFAAIEKAMQLAHENDVVVIAGKGAEDYQEINGIKHHFSDEEVVKQIAKKMLASDSVNLKRGLNNA